MIDGLVTRPANEAACDDLQVIFGTRGAAAYCQCQRYKLARGEAFARFPVEERTARLREQTHCSDAASATTSGLVAYLDGAPVGWCAVEPRPAYVGLVRVSRVPWDGRDEDRTDQSVWAVTCIFVRAGFRRRGIARALARTAVAHARERGAQALEAYPLLTRAGPGDEIQAGTIRMFAAAGMSEVLRPSKRRAVMRIDF